MPSQKSSLNIDLSRSFCLNLLLIGYMVGSVRHLLEVITPDLQKLILQQTVITPDLQKLILQQTVSMKIMV
jgi:hypothetical protein